MTDLASHDSNTLPARGVLSGVWSWMTTHRRIALAFLVLIVAATILRLLTFDRFLPYQDYTDESVHFILAQHLRGVENAAYLPDKYLDGTLYTYFNAAVQALVDALDPAPWRFLPDYILPLRLTSVAFGILTMLVISSIGWQFAGPLAGWLAAAIWGLTPVIVDRNSLALPDPLVYLLIAIMLSSILRAWKKTSPYWLLLSLVVGITIILVKVWPITMVLPFGILALWFTYRNPRRMWRWLVVYAIIAVTSAIYFLVVIDPFSAPSESTNIATFRDVGLQFALNLDRVFNNFWFAMYPIGDALFWVVLAGAAAAYWFNRHRQGQTLEIKYVPLLLLYAFLTSMLAASWTNISLGKIRHALPAGIALIGIWSAALQQIVWALEKWLAARSQNGGREKWLAYIPVLACMVILAPGIITGNRDNIARYQTRHIVEVLWTWTDNNVPVDGMVLTHRSGELERTWNRAWSGYDGDHPFEWWYETQEEIVQQTPQDYVERGIMYFMFTDRDRLGWYNSPELDAFIEQLTLVKVLPATPGAVTGTTAYFYRMAPPQIEASFNFGGELQLVGYDWATSALHPGNTIAFRPYWRIDRVPQSNYSMFVHLYPADEDTLIAQHDGPPTTIERLTSTWDDPQELYIGADVQLMVPADLQPGEYRLAIGIYDYITGERLTSSDGTDRFTIPIVIN